MDLNNNGKDDVQELKDAAGTFLTAVGHDLVAAAEAAWEWLKAELAKLSAQALAMLKAAVVEAFGNGDRPLGEVVADTLTILYREARELADEIKSDVVTALVGLTTRPALTAPAAAA